MTASAVVGMVGATPVMFLCNKRRSIPDRDPENTGTTTCKVTDAQFIPEANASLLIMGAALPFLLHRWRR